MKSEKETPTIRDSPSGKAADFDSAIRGFESLIPSQSQPKAKIVTEIPRVAILLLRPRESLSHLYYLIHRLVTVINMGVQQ